MKSTRNIATTLLATLGVSLVFAGAQAQSTSSQNSDAVQSSAANPATIPAPVTPSINQNRDMSQGMQHGQGPGMGQGKHHGMKGQRSEMSKLMTPEERTQMRAKMQAAKTPEERQAIRKSMRAEMQKRAKEKGMTLPDRQEGRPHQHGSHSG